MTDEEAREALRTAMTAWDGLTREEREIAIERAERRARAATRPGWLERAAGGPNFGGARTATR